MGKELKTVDIIRPGSINAIIGPVSTLKRMLKNQEYFNSRGYQVTVFTNESIKIGPILVPPPAVHSTVTWKSKLRKEIGSIVRMNARKYRWLSIYMFNKGIRRAQEVVDYYLSLDRHPDIIQFHSDAECYYYLKKRKSYTAKTVMFLHSDGIPFEMDLQYYPKLRNTTYLKRLKEEFDWTISQTDRLVFIAKVGQVNFLKLYSNRSLNDTSVIINGIDDLTDNLRHDVNLIKEKSTQSPFKYRLCCTGTINTRKGHRIIIEALHRLKEDLLSQIHVDFIGDGGERPVLETLVKEYGLEKHISFLGMIPNVEVYRYLAQNNIYILMSKNEGLPISIIEAMRAGLPIISTIVSGIPELVDVGYNGFLLNPDVDELVSFLNKLSEYDWMKIGNNSRCRYEKEFTFERMKREFCDMYDLLTKE